MTLKTLTLSVAAAALLAGGAIAQTSPNQDATQPATPPAATETPAAPSGSTTDTPSGSMTNSPNGTMTDSPSGTATDKTTMTDKSSGSMEYITRVDADQMLASKVTGMAVINAAGEELGDINDLILDQSGKPTVAVIGVGGFLGIGEKDVGVPFDQLQFAMNEQNENVARLDATKETLQAAPSFVYTENKEAAAAKVKTN